MLCLTTMTFFDAASMTLTVVALGSVAATWAESRERLALDAVVRAFEENGFFFAASQLHSKKSGPKLPVQ